GEKFGVSEERAVEAIMADSSWRVTQSKEAEVSGADLVDRYIDHVLKLLPEAGTLAGARIALDLANGATTATPRRVFERAGFEIVTIGDKPDGRNINLACGSTHPAGLVKAVVSGRCRMGV